MSGYQQLEMTNMTIWIHQQAIRNQNDARIISKIARQELDRFLENPTDENRFWAIHAQNAASDTQHCAMFCMGVVE